MMNVAASLTVLTYHHVGTRARECPLPILTIPEEQFARQMAWLDRRGYATVNGAQLLEWKRGAKPLPGRPILLTFDDAYADLETAAIPAMEKYGFTGTIFAITQRAGMPTPWDGMATMSEEQLRRCAARGFEIGGHTRTHRDLSTLDGDGLREEIGGAKRDLEAAGFRPVSFAYPYGRYNNAARASVEGAFELAFTGDEGRNTRATDALRMRRTMVLPCDTALDFALRVELGWSPAGRVGAWLRRRG
jgi:peptidoglycan/xylan/chitin deacetylase (PgdA/CDA1 family)